MEAEVPHDSFLGPLLVLAYINDLQERLISNRKIFADDNSIFLVFRDSNSSSLSLNPFYSSVTFLQPLKTSENQRFSDVFRGYRNVTLD